MRLVSAYAPRFYFLDFLLVAQSRISNRMRRSGRARPLLERASRGRLGRAVRLVEGSLRPLVADRSDRSRQDDGLAGSLEGEASIGCDDDDGQDRHRCVAGGIFGMTAIARCICVATGAA